MAPDRQAQPTSLAGGMQLPIPKTRLRWQEQAPGLVLLAADLAAMALSLKLALGLRAGLADRLLEAPGHAALPAACVLLLPLGCCMARLYPGYGLGAVEQLRRYTAVALGVTLALPALDYAAGPGDARASLILLGVLLAALPLLLLWQGALRCVLARRPWWGMAVTIVGAGPAGVRVAEALRQDRQLGLVATGFLDDDPETWGRTILDVPVIGPVSALERQPGRIPALAIIAAPGDGSSATADLVHRLPHRRIILALAQPWTAWTAWTACRDLNGTPCLELQTRAGRRRHRSLKRAFDLLAALLLASALLVPMLLIAALIRLTSRGPALFLQERCGVGGRHFRAVKFRTMVVDADLRLETLLRADPAARREYATFRKLRHDPRVTSLGRLLRKASLDELPQLWNVIWGQMSLVGPRPYLPRELQELGRDADPILAVRPGITGLWQATRRNEASFAERVSIDRRYVRIWSVWLDLHLLLRTLPAVLTAEGAR